MFLAGGLLLAAPAFSQTSLHDALLNNDANIRKSTIRNLNNLKPLPQDADILDTMTFLLEYENIPEISLLVLEYFEKRNSRDDFFYLSDYLVLVSHEVLIRKALSILDNLHRPTLRRELKTTILEKHRPDLFVPYIQLRHDLKADCDFNENDKKWAGDILADSRYFRYLSQLPPDRFLETHQLFSSCMELPADYAHLKKIYLGENISTELMLFYLQDWVPKLSQDHRYFIYKTLLRRNPEMVLDAAQNIPMENRPGLRRAILVAFLLPQESGEPSFRSQEFLLKLVAMENSPRFAFVIGMNYKESRPILKKAWIQKCETITNPDDPVFDSCHLAQIHENPQKAKDFLYRQKKEIQNRLVEKYLQTYLQYPEFQNREFYLKILKRENSRMTFRLYYHLSPEAFTREKEFLSAYASSIQSPTIRHLTEEKSAVPEKLP